MAQEEEGAARQRTGRKRGRGGGPGASLDGLADSAARRLNAANPKLALGGRELHVVAQREQVRGGFRPLRPGGLRLPNLPL